MYSKNRTFSHIYIEEAVRDHPRTRRILDRLGSATRVGIDDYQEVFGRGRQSFGAQKQSPKLILARKKDNHIYTGNLFIQSSELANFAYSAHVLNCPYDCQYCYLQGMYNSANVVVFVNLEDSFAAVETAIANRAEPGEPLRLAISYDTDLLALEGVTGFVGEWMDWVKGRCDIEVEIRTKSATTRLLEERVPESAVLFAWTLSPGGVAEAYEWRAPAVDKRLAAMAAAVEAGWRVKLCIDPIIHVRDWRTAYAGLVGAVRERLPAGSVEAVELGVFRLSGDHFTRMKKRKATDLLHYPYEHVTNAVSYEKKLRSELMTYVKEQFKDWILEDKIHLWI